LCETLRRGKSFLASRAHLRISSEIPTRLLLDLGIPLVKVGKVPAGS
jgi:hypothetical protein